MSSEDLQYPDEFTRRLEILWGEGFLSPGGAEEVRKILQSIDLEGKSIPARHVIGLAKSARKGRAARHS